MELYLQMSRAVSVARTTGGDVGFAKLARAPTGRLREDFTQKLEAFGHELWREPDTPDVAAGRARS